MSFNQILAKTNITAVDAGVNGNGTFPLFISQKFAAPQDFSAADRGLEVIVSYEGNLPDPEVSVAKYNLTCVIETEDEEGNWHPLINQFVPYVKAERGNKFIMRLDPDVLVLDPGVAIEIWNGVRNIAIESVKQGRLPDDFRVGVYVNELGYDALGVATAASFSSTDLTISYRTYG